jgi:hypothetical protein
MISTPALKQVLKGKNIELMETPTSEAVAAYNRLIGSDKRIAAGFHLTC